MKWINVEDDLPDLEENEPYSRDVLVCVICNGEADFLGITPFAKGEKYLALDRFVKWMDGRTPSFQSDRFHGKVTHWMELPKKPD